nr:hypothetical protein [Tanacetum cinerariifolium]
MIDYALWEVIKNGATILKTQVMEDITAVIPITIVEDKAQRRLESWTNLEPHRLVADCLDAPARGGGEVVVEVEIQKEFLVNLISFDASYELQPDMLKVDPNGHNPLTSPVLRRGKSLKQARSGD